MLLTLFFLVGFVVLTVFGGLAFNLYLYRQRAFKSRETKKLCSDIDHLHSIIFQAEEPVETAWV